MAKKLLEYKYTTDSYRVDPDGTIVGVDREEHSNYKVLHRTDEPYVKLFDVPYRIFDDLPKGAPKLLFTMAQRATFADEMDGERGMSIALTHSVREELAELLGYENIVTLNKYLSALKEVDLIRSIDRSLYKINPYVIGKGEQKDIEKARAAWDRIVKIPKKKRTF